MPYFVTSSVCVIKTTIQIKPRLSYDIYSLVLIPGSSYTSP